MKISVRLTLCAVIITTIAIVLCCALLLFTTANNQIASAIDNGTAELRMLDNAFNAEMEVVADEGLSDTARRSLTLFVFRKYADASVSGAHYILADEKDTLYNDCPIDPRPLLPGLKQAYEREQDTGDAQWPSAIAELDGRKYVATGRWSGGFGAKMSWEHEMYLVRDITGVYDGVTALGVRFAVIALIALISSALVMICLIRRTLRPLGGLQSSAAALANGQYDDRIAVRGNDELTELALSFNKMADAVARHIEALEDTAEQRTLLLAALTHELKTPLTALIGYSEALLRVNLPPKQRDESIAYLNRESKRIERLAQKMMRLITLQGGEAPDIKPHPVSMLYSAVGETLNEAATAEHIDLTFEGDGALVFVMDVDMMASVLINLFDNARNAGAKHISIAAEDGRIAVSDDGAGIPEHEIERVTQPFYRVGASPRQPSGGSGLGLALCELMVNAHGARLSIESQSGEGTTVSIFFVAPPM
jgi:signal transduction histidine kinase